MNYQPYEIIVKNLNNEDSIRELAKETEECFYLDYKQTEKDDYSQSRSIKGNDLSNIAKSISGFGNALGGILIFGVDNSKNLKPFKGYKIFETLVQESVSRSTNPQHEKIETLSVQSCENGKGYVIIIIRQSFNRPLQVIINGAYNHRYFYRSGESHRDIPHDVLVGMLGKKIPVKLSCQFQITDNKNINNNFEFSFVLRNNSSVIARDVWFNLDVGIPGVAVNQSASTNLFTGHKMENSMSMISIKDYRLPPQGYMSPVAISIPKNKLKEEQEYHLYFTYGCDGSKVYEFDSKFKGKNFNQMLNNDVEKIIEFFKSSSQGFIDRV